MVNAVTKAGTNQFRGVAFGFFQDGSLTTTDYFSKKKGLAKPDTQYQRWGGTFGGPIIRDKIHFFGSLERFAIDRPNTINIPARPDLAGTQVTKDRVWNTVIRGDHQVNNSMTYSVRWLREASPQVNQIIPTGTQAAAPAAAREEADVDQTVSANLNLVMSNTRVSTFRVTWTRENVAFANECFNSNNRDFTKCPVTLAYQDYIDQQDNTAQARINDGIQLEETLAWFLPGHKGDHDLKVGVQYRYSGADNENQGNLNGTFSFGRNNVPFNAAVASTYPDRLTIRVGGASTFYEKAHYISAFAQDKWRMGSRVTLNLGLRYDVEVIPIEEVDDPLVDEYPSDRNNLAPRLGMTYDMGRNGVIRFGAGRFFDKTNFEIITRALHGHALHELVHRELPHGGGRQRSAHRPVPDGSLPRQRSRAQHDPAEPALSGRPVAAEYRGHVGQPRSTHPVHRRDHHRVRAAARCRHDRQRRLRPLARP